MRVAGGMRIGDGMRISLRMRICGCVRISRLRRVLLRCDLAAQHGGGERREAREERDPGDHERQAEEPAQLTPAHGSDAPGAHRPSHRLTI